MDKERDGRKREGEQRRDKGKERKREGDGREGVIIKAVGSGSASTYMCIYGQDIFFRVYLASNTMIHAVHVQGCTCMLTIILLNSPLSSTTDIPEGSGVAGTLQNTERVHHSLALHVHVIHAPPYVWECGQCVLLDISDEVLCNDLYHLWVIDHPTTWKE